MENRLYANWNESKCIENFRKEIEEAANRARHKVLFAGRLNPFLEPEAQEAYILKRSGHLVGIYGTDDAIRYIHQREMFQTDDPNWYGWSKEFGTVV